MLTICADDALEELLAYMPDKIKSYGDIRDSLPCHMRRTYDLFQRLEHGPLLIAPWGDYGYGFGPYGGGETAHYELLQEIRLGLGRPVPQDSHADRDARHLMHSVLYRCDYFLTMDYRVVDRLSRLPARLAGYVRSRGHRLQVCHPVCFWGFATGVAPEAIV